MNQPEQNGNGRYVSDLKGFCTSRRYKVVEVGGLKVKLQSLTAAEAMMVADYFQSGEHQYATLALHIVDEHNKRTHVLSDRKSWEYMKEMDARVFGTLVEECNKLSASPTVEELEGNCEPIPSA